MTPFSIRFQLHPRNDGTRACGPPGGAIDLDKFMCIGLSLGARKTQTSAPAIQRRKAVEYITTVVKGHFREEDHFRVHVG